MQSMGSATQLRSLELFLFIELWGLPDAIWHIPLASLTKLTSLTIHEGLLSAATVTSLVCLTNLQELRLRNVSCTSSTCTALNAIGGTSKVMQDLASKLVKLTCIDFSDSPIFSWSHFSALKTLPLLEELHLQYVSRARYDPKYFRDFITSVQGLPIASATFWLDAADLIPFTTWLHVKVPGELQWLTVWGKTDLWDTRPELADAAVSQVVAAFKEAGPQFKGLGLIGFGNLKNHHVVELAGLTQLTYLCLERCGVDDAALCHLSSLASLESLFLKGNRNITGAGDSMQVFADHMPKLTQLVITA